jgi:hypothetical protein
VPRSRTKLAATEPAAAAGVRVEPNAVFTRESFLATFRLRESSLRREVREGRLRVYKRCGRYFILGEDVLEWLKGGLVHPAPRK